MRIALHLPVNRILLFDNTLWNSNALPLRAPVVHTIHQFSMPTDVLRVCIRTVPVGKRGLFSHSAFSWHELAISHDVCPRLLDALTFGLSVRSNLHVTMHVNVNNTVDFVLEVVSHIFDDLLIL